jgi:Asp-tRNA(Asn)/Glu-tRNA(Gln) amidotransferase C subunit
MTQPPAPRISAETVRQLAAAVGLSIEEARLGEVAAGLGAMIAVIERAEVLDLDAHEPCTTLELSGGAPDAER